MQICGASNQFHFKTEYCIQQLQTISSFQLQVSEMSDVFNFAFLYIVPFIFKPPDDIKYRD